ncbi:MAG: hypothetical protein Fur0012_05650 [Elusimicrobiota bacterium]
MVNKILITCKEREIASLAFSKIISISKERFCGFETERIEAEGCLLGYDLITISGKREKLASVDLISHFSFNKYGLNREAVEGLACASFPQDGKVTLLKDLGPMFFRFPSFREKFRLILASDSPLIVISGGLKDLRNCFLSLDDAIVVDLSSSNYSSSIKVVIEKTFEFLRRNI